MIILPDAYVSKRIRKVQKTIAFVAGGSDQMVVVGPCDEVVIGVRGTTGAGGTVPVDCLGLRRALSKLEINSNVRGTVGNITGISLGAVQRCTFGPTAFEQGSSAIMTVTNLGAPIAGNSAACKQVTGGAAGDGWEVVLPFGIDSGEICTFTFTMGTLAETGGQASYSGVFRMTVSLAQPKTYWAYRTQSLGVAGVVGATSPFTQPLAPVVPSFAMVGGIITAIIADTTSIANVRPGLDTLLVTVADDYLIDDKVEQIRAMMGRRIFGIIPSWHTPYRHVPVANDASYLVQFVTATATIAPSEIVYLYQSGVIAKTGMGITPAASAPAATTGGAAVLPQPTRVLNSNQAAPPLTAGGGVKGLFGPR